MPKTIESYQFPPSGQLFERVELSVGDTAIAFRTGTGVIKVECPGGTVNSIVTLGDGQTIPYRRVLIVGPDSNTMQYAESGNIRLAPGPSRILGPKDSVELMQHDDGNWYELSNTNH